MSDDADYKEFFSYPEMVRDLIRAFVPGDWVAALDFSTLERVNGSYVTPDGGSRHSDVVWKLRICEEEWLYLYVLLEFQSKPDPWMALRMLVYVGLLYQDLAKRGELTAGGRLPLVCPIVLYNGAAPWAQPHPLVFAPAATQNRSHTHPPSHRSTGDRQHAL